MLYCRSRRNIVLLFRLNFLVKGEKSFFQNLRRLKMATKPIPGGLNVNRKKVMNLKVPIHACTIGYEGQVKMTFGGQEISFDGDIKLVADPSAPSENKVSLSWYQDEE